MKKIISFLALFTSLGTLLCCALPALFVTLGFGAAFAGLVANVPQVIWLSENKLWIFGLGAVMLTIGGYLQWRGRNEPCPIDRNLAAACSSARKASLFLYFSTVGIYTIGAFFAFIAPRLF